MICLGRKGGAGMRGWGWKKWGGGGGHCSDNQLHVSIYIYENKMMKKIMKKVKWCNKLKTKCNKFIYIFHFSHACPGLEKAPRWAKISSKSFQNQDMLGLCYTFSLCLSLSLSLYIERERWVKCLMTNNMEWHQQKYRVSQETFQQKNAG